MYKRVFNRRISQLGELVLPSFVFNGTALGADEPVEIRVTDTSIIITPATCGCKNLFGLIQTISDDEGAFCTAARNAHMIGFPIENMERGCECTKCHRIVCDQCQATTIVEAEEM